MRLKIVSGNDLVMVLYALIFLGFACNLLQKYVLF